MDAKRLARKKLSASRVTAKLVENEPYHLHLYFDTVRMNAVLCRVHSRRKSAPLLLICVQHLIGQGGFSSKYDKWVNIPNEAVIS